MTATMEETARRFFSSVVSDEEWKAIPSEIAKKIESLTEGKFEELITSKALSETAKFNAEKTLTELQNEFETVKNENEQFKNKLEAATSTINELESQLSNTVSETTKLRETCNRLEKEVSDFRHQRNLAVDERDEFSKMLERRNAEIERTQSDLLAVTKQFEAAVSAKCEALAKSEEVAALKMTLEYKEKRIEQERNLLNQQMETLTEELRNKTDELMNMRRDNTTRCFQLETKLTEKLQELKLATDTVKTLTDTNNNLLVKIEEFNKKLVEEKDIAVKTQEAFQHEMDAQKKLASLYKDMSQEKTDLAEKLTEGFQEVKGKLDEAVEKYGELETKHKETCLSHEEILSKKTECIAMLKKELEAAQDLIENVKSESFQKEVEGLSPSAAITSKFIKSGMTMTQIYSEYTSAVEQLTTSREEEIEDKSPYLAKQREDYEKALDTIAELTKQNDDLINDMQGLRDSASEAKRSEGVVSRENSRLKKELQDLGRQVCHLLREVEQSRAGSSSTSTDQDLSDSTSSADIITKRLVTFSDISELQANNQRLLALVRELSSKHEEVEELDLAEVAKLKTKVENMREQHADLLEQQERQAKMMNMLINQRDMYKSLYSQAVKGTGEDMINLENSSRENSAESPKRDFENQGEEKTHELEVKIENLQKEIKTAKEEYEMYKKEKTANEKILLEQMEKCRSDLNDMVCQNAKLTTKIETSDEMFKVLKNNTAIYKNQIEKLEERNKIYTETIAKHETSSKYLRDEAIDAQTKLARAEVLVSNFQKENLLLRDSEARLLKERESLKREAHAQNLMQTNIELIKATLERNDAESKMRLEQQLQEAHRECAALRRRLQEEQDRFRQLTEHLEKQTQTAQSRMEEEKAHAEKLRNELVSMREDLTAKSMQVEDLSKKLKTSLFSGTGSSGDSKKYRELEKMLNERQVEIESLQEKLKAAKEAIEQHSNIAECAEKQLVEISEQNKKYKEAAENKIKEQDQRIKQLEEQCSELQGELSVYNDGQESAILERAQIQTAKELADAKRELDATRNEIKVLQQNLESAENKYVHEMMLHSNDLKTLTTIKEELTTAVSEIEAVKSARDKANIALEESKQCWSKQEELFTKEKEELEKRFKDLDAQNSLLLNQLQELNAQLSIVQAQTSDSNTSLGDVSFNRSLTEDDVKSSEQLLKIIKYLRQEKDIAVSKCEILEAEHVRLKSQFDVIGKQLEEAKTALETERETSDVSFVTAAKHAEVLRKVETLNAITDSNRSLRIERDSLLGQVNELRARTASLEEQLAPLQEKNRELTIKAEAMQTENLTLRGEATRWRQRANMLIEKSNRTSPEDWKKLQNERESLAKQLMVERSNNTQLNAEVNNLTKEKAKLDEQLKDIRRQVAQQKEDLDRLNEEVSSLRNQVTTLSSDLTQNRTEHGKLTEEHKALTEEGIAKEAMITDLKNNLVQIRKIAKKYKTQCEEQSKELESLKQQLQESKESEIPADKQEQFRQEGRSEVEERLNEVEQTHQLKLDEVNQQVTTVNEENESYKKEIENLKQTSLEKEERFKTLFKNAKDRIMTLTEQNTSLKAELSNQERQGKGTSDIDKEKAEEIDRLKREKDDIQAEKQAEKERLTQEIETLTQRVNQLQRQLGLQQGSKPSTSSGPTEKSTTEPPTANIKPMSGHSTTQTQSVTIQPWRSGVEPPLASIRPMSMQLRTVAALRTGQSPSVMVPPQQVHTTGTSNIEALSSSPTSSHTDYAPATSSASSAMLGPRQVAVPPTQSSQDAEDEENSMQVQTAPQQQAVALVLPRVEPPNSASGPTQEQGTSSSSSSNTVTTTQAGHKRPREADADGCQSDENTKQQQQPKRTRVQGAPETFQSVSESGLEVEYQVPTSSQRDHEEDTEAVIVVESDEEGDGPDEGEGADDDPDDPDTEGYDMEATYVEQMNFEDAECQDVEEDEAGNEVEVIEDSSEVPNQSERQEVGAPEESAEQAQSEATSSGTDGGASCGVTVSQASTSVSVTMPSSRTRPVAPLSRQQQTHLLLPEEGGDDGIVPSTPTLFVPRRSDGFGEAVSSPNVPTSGRFTFNESGSQNNTSNEVIPEQTLEANLDDDSTGRSVPSTPLQASPQEAGPSGEEQSSHQTLHTDGEIPSITVSGVGDETEQAPEGSTGDMGPPSVAGTSTETQGSEQAEEMLEGDDGVSSEGEKSITTKEGGGEEEGREAEASPSTNTRSKAGTTRGSGGSSRRSLRQSHMRGGESRPGPTPIVWADQRDNRHGTGFV
ncbi:nucleoprotein tpr-related [Holotrichia oblita]|uniref:Nucleoprotein tpr-related n=1 Tax=Holotrichia oblita TaxID=644536 RepID=A0ACB9TWG0_HOLOL|nr:nucleoprotein tpr-related [Holotrichia oblita]